MLKQFFKNTDHLHCGNPECSYDGEWCYHFTDKDYKELESLLQLPMGIDEWKAQGEKYGYFEYLNIIQSSAKDINKELE